MQLSGSSPESSPTTSTGSFLDGLFGYAKQGAEIYNAVTNNPNTGVVAPAAAPAPASKPNWLLIGGIGAVFLALIAVLAFRGSK